MKSGNKQEIDTLLSSANLRRTSPRIAVLNVLLRARTPQTARQIIAKLPSPAPDKVTIYRTLETLVSTGLVHKAFMQKKNWHFELSHNCTENQCHPHFTCTSCGATHCLTEISLPMAKSPYKGFIVSRQRTQLEGICPKCKPHS